MNVLLKYLKVYSKKLIAIISKSGVKYSNSEDFAHYSFRHESQFKKWVFHSKIFDWKSHIGQKKYFLNTHSISILLTLSYRPQGTQKNKKNIFLAFSYAIYKFIVCHFNKMNDILKIVLIFFAYSTFMNKIIEKYLMINQTSFQILEFESITDFVSKITKEFGMPFLAYQTNEKNSKLCF